MLRLRSAGQKIGGAFVSGGKRTKEYLLNLANDYKIVVTEAATDVREKPWKGVAAGSLIVSLIYAIKTNPDDQNFESTVIKNQSILTLVGDPIRNPRSNDRVQSALQLWNENRLARLNLILFSIMWRRDYAKECDLYAAQCKVLKPNWRDFKRRFIDVGFCGRWVLSELAMRNYDVNENEFLM